MANSPQSGAGPSAPSTNAPGSGLDRNPSEADQPPGGGGAEAMTNDSQPTLYRTGGRSFPNAMPTSHTEPTHETDRSAERKPPHAPVGMIEDEGERIWLVAPMGLGPVDQPRGGSSTRVEPRRRRDRREPFEHDSRTADIPRRRPPREQTWSLPPDAR